MPEVYGSAVDGATRCVHYHSSLDIVAIKMKCCGRYYPCYKCHGNEHEMARWSQAELDAGALVVMCGECRHEMTFEEYRPNRCGRCQARFNPHCAGHYHLYFDLAANCGCDLAANCGC